MFSMAELLHLFAKLGCFIDNKMLLLFRCNAIPGAVADILLTKSVPVHFLIRFQDTPAS